MPPERLTITEFATVQLSLLDRERLAEIEETQLLLSQTSPTALARAGLAVLNLGVASQRTGLGGKTVIELELDSAVKTGNGELPEHGIRTGDIVSVSEQPKGSERKSDKLDLKKKGVEGVVSKIANVSISVALDKEDADVPGGRLWLVKLANDVTFKRMNQVMTRLQSLSESEYSSFMRVLFGLSSPTPVPANLDDPNKDLLPSLNESQRDAVKFALASKEVALIHGPPGTGKTHTLIELILQLLKQNLRILVCGPSNISVDNIVERLAHHKVPMVRLGHPARLLPSVLNHSLDVLTRTSDAAAIVRDVRKEMDEKQASIRKTKSGKERRQIYADLRELRKEYREREKSCVENLVRRSKVVLATLHGAGGFHLKSETFDVVIVDEASQALEAQCWVPLMSARKVVLAGDHLQLPPTIKSVSVTDEKGKENRVKDAPTGAKGAKDATTRVKDATADVNLETTLFDRLLKLHGPKIKRMLTTQYRMHEKIMAFPSSELYESKLIAADDVKLRLLNGLPGVDDTEDTREPLIFFDTQGGDFPEKTEDELSSLGESKSNDGEAALVKMHVGNLVRAGVKPEDIAVVTPYNAQLAILSQLLKETHAGIELGSVDGFQGREKEAVVVSLVRSGGEIGFLAEKRRLNVSMTRPRRQLTVIGDSETLSRGSSFLRRWCAHLEAHADLRYASASDVHTRD